MSTTLERPTVTIDPPVIPDRPPAPEPVTYRTFEPSPVMVAIANFLGRPTPTSLHDAVTQHEHFVQTFYDRAGWNCTGARSRAW